MRSVVHGGSKVVSTSTASTPSTAATAALHVLLDDRDRGASGEGRQHDHAHFVAVHLDSLDHAHVDDRDRGDLRDLERRRAPPRPRPRSSPRSSSPGRSRVFSVGRRHLVPTIARSLRAVLAAPPSEPGRSLGLCLHSPSGPTAIRSPEDEATNSADPRGRCEPRSAVRARRACCLLARRTSFVISADGTGSQPSSTASSSCSIGSNRPRPRRKRSAGPPRASCVPRPGPCATRFIHMSAWMRW